MMSRQRLSGLAVLVGVLSGCGTGPVKDVGTGATPDVGDAVPRYEPLCKTGNPLSYDVFGKRYYPMKSSAGFEEEGIASWYGADFHGKRTSCGEPYDMYQMTAAHKLLPIPTYCEVTNLDNGRKVIVKVNDRGPFHEDRVIDLSYAAALKLGIARPGTGRVSVRALDPSVPMTTTPMRLASRDAPATARRIPPVAARPEAPPVATQIVAKPAALRNDARPAATTRSETSLTPLQPTAKPAAQSAPVRTAAPAAELVPLPAPAPAAAVASRPNDLADPAVSKVYVQVGAFADKLNAERLKNRIVPEVDAKVYIQQAGFANRSFYRVQIGPLSDGLAGRVTETLLRLGLNNHRVIAN
jgi:rare lipoprotein A